MTRMLYPSDLTDEQWRLIQQRIPPALPGGRHRSVDMREVFNGILYLNRSGCSWRSLPHDFPPWGTVHYYYRRFRLDGSWKVIHDQLREKTRVAAGKKPTPSAAVIDSQSVKTTGKRGVRGYDAGKKINGRKRHLIVDTLGLILVVVVHAASIQDRDGAKLALRQLAAGFGRLRLIWADGGYAGQLVAWVAALGCHWVLQIVKRNADVKGFKVLPKRWIVERTFGWLGRYRRHSKDYEALTESSEAMIRISMINLMLHRLKPG
ncbi:MAG: IS5 family transposase [Candidatus Angelobacter sp.]